MIDQNPTKEKIRAIQETHAQPRNISELKIIPGYIVSYYDKFLPN